MYQPVAALAAEGHRACLRGPSSKPPATAAGAAQTDAHLAPGRGHRTWTWRQRRMKRKHSSAPPRQRRRSHDASGPRLPAPAPRQRAGLPGDNQHCPDTGVTRSPAHTGLLWPGPGGHIPLFRNHNDQVGHRETEPWSWPRSGFGGQTPPGHQRSHMQTATGARSPLQPQVSSAQPPAEGALGRGWSSWPARPGETVEVLGPDRL